MNGDVAHILIAEDDQQVFLDDMSEVEDLRELHKEPPRAPWLVDVIERQWVSS
jgi:hypothetical protein